MALFDATTQYLIGTILLLVLSGFLLLKPTGLVRWLQKKNYQYEVTFSLYMLTPTEKFVFNSILFLTLSMLLLACIVYLPNHLSTMMRRAYYYCAGDNGTLLLSSRHAAESLYGTATGAGEAVLEAATGWAHNAYQAAMNMNKSAAATATAARGGAEMLGQVGGD